MFAKHSSGGFALHLIGKGGAGIARAEGTSRTAPAGGSTRQGLTGQPSARHMAQMRLAATKAGLTGPLADLMAETGVTPARADAVAAGG